MGERDRISIQAQAVLQIFDSFTYMPVKGSMLRFFVEESRVLAKEDGFFVVTGKRPLKQLRIESPIYQAVDLILPEECVKKPLNLWLDPGEAYPYGEKTTRLRLNGKPNGKFFVFFPQVPPFLRLMKDVQAGDQEFMVHQEKNRFLRGASVLLYAEGEEPVCEIIKISDLTEGRCTIDEPVKHSYRKRKAGLYGLRCVSADSTGVCTIALTDREWDTYVVFDEDGRVVRRAE